MNRKQRRITQSQGKQKAVIHFHGGSYTIEEAGSLAVKEQSLGNVQAAVDIYDRMLAQVPDNAGVYNNRGITLQALKRYKDALTSHNKAIALNPDYAEAHNSRGATLQEMKRYDEALASYDEAIKLRPDYGEAYYNRGITLHTMKRYDDALASYDKAIALKPDNAEAYNNRGAILQEIKRYDEALTNFDKAIALKPGYGEAYNNQGVAFHKIQRFGDALASFDKAIAFKSGHALSYYNRGNALQEIKRYDDALASYDKAIALHPGFAEAYNNRSATLQKMKLYDEALANCDKAIAINPDYAEAYQNRGLILVNKGDMQDAEKMFRRAHALKTDFPDPLVSLTDIHIYQGVDDANVKCIQALLHSPGTSEDDRSYLYFALGKIYDDCGLYDDAFECYRQANQIRNATVSYNANGMTGITSSIIDVFSKDFLAQKFAFTPDSQSPLFIVGMPRSGTTLLANIVSNHRSIGTAGELTTITESGARLSELTGKGIPYPYAVQQLTPAIATRLIRDYEKRLRRDVGPDAVYVIDKHPLNFRHLGFIAMLFPGAHIMHCTRHPMDTGLSNYFQRFSSYYDYSFDLRNIGHFYGEYARLMEHWRRVLPLKMIEISYEDMITNTERIARRALDFLGLEWDKRCLAPHTNPHPVETASRWQVRQPIYNQSVGRWRHYEEYLTPLKEMLQRSGQIPA